MMSATQAEELLGIPQDRLTEALLKRSYRAALLRWHPDKNARRVEEAHFWTVKINEAKSVLDVRLRGSRPAPPAGGAAASDDVEGEKGKKEPDLYNALSVARTASAAEISAALEHLRAALRAGEEAHAVLSDPTRRRNYDGGFIMLDR